MNPAEQLIALGVEDVQGGGDQRGVTIDEVGIEELSYPVAVEGRDGSRQQTVAEVAMAVELAADRRGTHMSRFVEILDAYAGEIGPRGFPALATEVRSRLDSERARISMSFPFFLPRQAPVSELTSLVRYGGSLRAEATEEGTVVEVGVRVPITSLCPCSKEISDYGAHNQRGQVEIAVGTAGGIGDAVWFEDLIEAAEAAASAPIYPLLKRSDERHVTMQAYDNPAFVEDVVRDVVVSLRGDRRIARGRVRACNHESIHDHSAVAQVRWERPRG